MTADGRNTHQSKPPKPDVTHIINLPSEWEFHRLRHIADVRPSNVDKKSDDSEPSVELCNYTDVYYNNTIDGEISFMEATATRPQISKFELNGGDIMLTKDSESWDDIGVPTYVPQDLPGVLCGYHLYLIRPNPELVHPYYLYWSLESEILAFQFEQVAKGVTRYGISTYETSVVDIPVPPLHIQTQISRYLDRETSKIDRLCSKMGSEPEILMEKRQALITKAVTGQIDLSDWELPDDQDATP